MSALSLDTPNDEAFNNKILLVSKSKLNQNKKKIINLLKKRQKHEKKVILSGPKNIINKLKKKFKKIKIYDHHTSHAASAYYFSKFKKMLCFNH